MKRKLVAIVTFLLLGSSFLEANWKMFQFDTQHSGADLTQKIRLPLELDWKFNSESDFFTYTSPVFAQGTVYIPTPQGKLYAIDFKNGNLKWQFSAQGQIYLTPAVDTDRVYLGSTDGNFYALDSENGEIIWQVNIGNNLNSSPIFTDGVIYFGANDGYLYAFNTDGNLKWKTFLDDYICSSPAIAEEKVYIATLNGTIYSLDKNNGKILWEYQTEDLIRCSPGLTEDKLFVGSHDGNLYVLGTDGVLKWKFQTGGPIHSSPATGKDVLYVASLDKNVYALNINDGSLKWKFESENEIYNSPVLVDGLLFFSSGKKVYALDPLTGEEKWNYIIEGKIISSFATAYGRIVFLADDGNLYLFKSPNQPPELVSNLLVNNKENPFIGNTSLTFNWTFNDSDLDDAQSAFQMQISSIPEFTSLVYDSGKVITTDNQNVVSPFTTEDKYFWRVKTWDSFDAEGSWTDGSEFFIVDLTPPETTIMEGIPQYESYVISLTSFSLVAIDKGLIPSGVQYVEYRINSGSWQNYTQAFYLSGTDGNYTIDYRASDNVQNLETYKSLSVKLDNTPPVAKLEVIGMKYELEGKTYIRPDTEIILSALDPLVNEVASGLAKIVYSVDGILPFTPYTSHFTLGEGIHLIKYYAIDNLGNTEIVHTFTFYVDATVPITDLDIGTPQYDFGDGRPVLVSGRTPFTLIAYDPLVKEVASGVRNTFYRIAETTSVPFSVYTSSFTLSPPDGDKLVEYYSVDNVENTELIKSTTITLDNIPPVVRIISPSGENTGLCKIVNGTTTIVGSVSDLHFKWYQLEYKAVIGNGEWVMVKDKTYQEVNEEILATWDVTGLTEGWYKIRLTAQDCVANEASAEVEIYVGKPTLLYSFGKIGNAPSEFNSPSYIVRDSSGNIWISDTNNDRIQKFDSEGKWLATLGGVNPNKKKGEAITFNKPTGLAIDSGSNLYVADRNNDRVLKFSVEDSTGTSPYTTKIISGFNKPHGLAIDKEDNLYVADRNNDRIQKFDKDGNLLLTINTGVGFGDGSASLTTSLNKPQGVMAISQILNPNNEILNTKLYVSDRNNDRILVYELTDSTDTTVQTVITGFNKPDGIAVNNLGYLYVADTNNDRIQKFDKYGNFVMSFGGSSTSLTTGFNKPAGITLDEEGNLYAVDSNNGQVKVFGLPDSSRIAASPITYSPLPINEFVLGEYYSFPNPAKYGNPPAGGPTIHFECGLADKVEIRIYDLAGDLIHEKEISGNQWQIIDGKYCYEYAWDISNVASGIYIYCIQAKKSSYPDIKVRKKLAVIK